jgi:hypothetical protein
MAMAQILEFKGIGVDKYDALMSELAWIDNNSAPEGLIAHAAGASGDDLYIIEWWESVSDWDRFLAERLQPALQKVGGIPQPTTVHFEVHNRYP